MPDYVDFSIIPTLGRKTDVPEDDESLFRYVRENLAFTHDTGGVNFDLVRKRNTCTKSQGYVQWSNSANAQATKCLGLAEIYDGTNRDYCFFDNGKFYVYDSALDPQDKTAAGVTHALTYPYSIIKVGNYVVWADREDGNTPYKWKNGDANATKLAASGTEYKFRYLENFQRRVIGAYSDQTDGDIEIRWSTAWPSTAITSLNFPAANQLYVPNDDSIAGIRKLGEDRCYVYCEDSIQQLVYYPDYSTPFRCFTVISAHGGVNQHSIIPVLNMHFFFSPDVGFAMFDGSNITPISNDIHTDVEDINPAYYDLIVGTFVPIDREIVWTVPMGGSATPTHLVFYGLENQHWRIEDKTMNYLDHWKVYDSYTMTDLINDATAAGYPTPTMTNVLTWKGSSVRMSDIALFDRRLVYAKTDGHLYLQNSEALAGANIDGYRIEPILDFGDKHRYDLLEEIWFDLDYVANFSIDVYHRSGNTVGELVGQSWTSIGSVSCNSPSEPRLAIAQNARLHQIKWGSDQANERFQVSRIRFRYVPGRSIH